MSFPELLALDFDGVICNGLREYFRTAWKAYCEIWQPADLAHPVGLAERFYHLRPVVETGWEMPVLIHALESGFHDREILKDWQGIALELLHHHQVDPREVGSLVDGIRDRWIADDLDHWLAEHEFYPGVIDQLRSWDKLVIISTKEGRFIQALLQRQGLDLDRNCILGKEQKRPKHEILRQFQKTHTPIWFVEDRLKTLHSVEQQLDLTDVSLFLADWGYNLPEERTQAQASDRIQLLSLQQFAQDFSSWC
ncbi:MAG: HAD family hydrolase [Synechococcales bacterium]|nr:HAD family hydrolase [Synechococcales bacterium]